MIARFAYNPSANFHQALKSPGTYLVASIVAEKFGKGVFEYPSFADFTVPCEKNSDLSIVVGTTIKNKPFYCSNINFKNEYGVQVLDAEETYAKGAMPVDGAGDNFSTKYIKNELPVTYLANGNKAGKLLVIGNSFSVPILYDLGKYFGEILRIHDSSLLDKHDQLSDVVKAYGPEYILFVCVSPSGVKTFAEVLHSIYKK